MTGLRPLSSEVAAALSEVIDPEIGRSVVDVGLIYSADLTADDHMLVRMTTTTPGCPATSFLVDAVRQRVLSAGLADSVDVELTYEPPWTPLMMRG
jgi:metal-sulfur cluster biosynthetic enzyme